MCKSNIWRSFLYVIAVLAALPNALFPSSFPAAELSHNMWWNKVWQPCLKPSLCVWFGSELVLGPFHYKQSCRLCRREVAEYVLDRHSYYDLEIYHLQSCKMHQYANIHMIFITRYKRNCEYLIYDYIILHWSYRTTTSTGHSDSHWTYIYIYIIFGWIMVTSHLCTQKVPW